MIITLSPMRHDGTLSLARSGDTLVINGDPLDLSVIPEGATVPGDAVDCPWVAGPISRDGGVLHLTMILPLGPIPWPAPPEARAVTHPEPILVTEDGPISLPHYDPPPPDPDDQEEPAP